MERIFKINVTFWFLAFLYQAAGAGGAGGTDPFERQARALLRHVRPLGAHRTHTARLLRDLERNLQLLWPGSRVEQFGATAIGLALKSSDVDCFVLIPNRNKINTDDSVLISEVETLLTHRPDLFTSIALKPNVHDSVLTFEHVPTKISVDLSVTSPLVIRAALILSQLLNLEERIMNMAVIVKYWSYVHGITGNVNVLASYTVTLLLIFYLQQRNILPTIAELQEKASPMVVDHWNTGFDLSGYQIEINESLYELLGGFFKYYSNFNFEDVISPYCGCILKREQIVNMDLPEVFSPYENNLKLGFTKPFIFGPVNVQDIFSLDNNTGRPWNNRSMLENLISHIKFAAKTFETEGSDRFLLAILENKDMDILPELVVFEGL